jgi:hypothetical protein
LAVGNWIRAKLLDVRLRDAAFKALMREANLIICLGGVGGEHAYDAACPWGCFQPSEIRFQDHYVSSRKLHSAHGIPSLMGRRNTKGRALPDLSLPVRSLLPVHPWSA